MPPQTFFDDAPPTDAAPAALSRALRTHLNGVLGMTELTLATDLDELQRLYLVLARASALAMLRCVEALEEREAAEESDGPLYL
jgi:hypothetical protein